MNRVGAADPVETTIPTPPRHGIPLTVVGRERGLPSAQVHNVTQDRHGRIWMAGPSGLCCHHGTAITVHTQADSLTTHGLRAVVALPAGGLVIGSDLGVDEGDDDDRFWQVLGPGAWSHGLITRMVVGGGGAIWVATSRALVEWRRGEDGGVRVHEAVEVRSGLTLAADRAGAIWASGGTGLQRFRGGCWADVVEPGRLLEAVGIVWRVAPADAGMAVAGDRGFAIVSHGGSVEVVGAWAEPDAVTALACDEDEVWLARSGTIHGHRRRAGVWSLAHRVDVGARVNDLYIDAIRNVWVATDNLGLVKISSLRDAMRPPPARVPGAVFSIACTGGTVLIGGDSGAVRMDARGAAPIDALAQEDVWHVVSDADGVYWAATQHGLLVGDADRMALAEPQQLRAPGRVLIERRDGMWLGNVSGLFRLSRVDGRVQGTPVPGPEGMPLGYVYTLVEDATGVLWIGTIGGGLWREAPRGGLRQVVRPGLTPTGNTYAIAIAEDLSLAVVQDNRVVLITPDGEGRVVMSTRHPVAGWAATFHRGTLVIGSARGLRFHEWPSGALIRTVAGGRVNGWEFTTSRSLATDERGRLWCGTNNGCSIVDPEWFAELRGSRALRVFAVRWSHVTPEVVDGVAQVVEGRWSLSLRVGAPWFVDEDDLRLRHRLLGFDQEWSDFRSPEALVYRSLPVGHYTLQVQARSPLLGPGAVEDLFELRVLAAPADGAPEVDPPPPLLSPFEVEQQIRRRTLELEEENRSLRKENEALGRSALVDALTQIGNRRAFDAELARGMSRTRRHGQALALVLIDIDHFKAFNDSLGHVAGDRCLAKVARALASSLRPEDAVSRYGGEEFAVILADTQVDEVIATCARLRARITELAVEHPASPTAPHLTISLGAVLFRGEPGVAAVDVVRAADRALYRAKRGGRDRLELGALADEP